MLIGDARKRVQARAFSASQDNTLHLYGFSLRSKAPVVLMLPQAPESSGDKIRVSQRVQDSRYGRSSFLRYPQRGFQQRTRLCPGIRQYPTIREKPTILSSRHTFEQRIFLGHDRSTPPKPKFQRARATSMGVLDGKIAGSLISKSQNQCS